MFALGSVYQVAAATTCTPPPSASGTKNIQQYCVPDCAGTNSNSSGCSNVNATNCNANNCDLIKAYLNPAVNLLSGLVGIVVVIGIISGAIQYSASAGNPQAAAKGRSKISNSVIALIVFAFIYAFLQWIVPGGIFNGG